jgi:hypothetical protein
MKVHCAPILNLLIKAMNARIVEYVINLRKANIKVLKNSIGMKEFV